jgi:hypothetical protein
MDISGFNIFIWIWKLTFQCWNFEFNFRKLFDLEIDIWILNYHFAKQMCLVKQAHSMKVQFKSMICVFDNFQQLKMLQFFSSP